MSTKHEHSSDGASAPEATRLASGADNPSEDEVPGAPGAEATIPPESTEAGADDHQRKVELDLDELEAKAEKADEYLELAQRTKADFENYRKRAAREASAAQDRGMTKLARELLPAIDNLERALEAAGSSAAATTAAGSTAAATTEAAGTPGASAAEADNVEDAGDTLATGIKLVQADLVAALARVGIESFMPVGEQFDPQRHEAIAQQPIDGAEPGTIVEVFQRGYTLGESVLRPARVVVAG